MATLPKPSFVSNAYALFKRGWNEIPEVMGSGILAVLFTGLAYYGSYKTTKKNKCMKTYKYKYTVYREDDPKVAELRKYKVIE